jgi:hypothetical protein
MRMLRWCCGHTRRDRVRNDDIRDMVGVASIEKKLIQHRLRWFGHVQWRPPEAPVRSGVLKRADNVKSGRGRPKLTWEESVKRDLKEWNISKDLAMDRSAWRLTINVSEPWPLSVLCPLCPFLCLPVYRLFWVSSLAYPNLLGTKNYVVVVVVGTGNKTANYDQGRSFVYTKVNEDLIPPLKCWWIANLARSINTSSLIGPLSI